MTLPANYGLSLQRGDDFALDLVVKGNGLVIDLTGSRITFQLVSGPITISLDSDASTITLDPTAGKISIRLTPSQTLSLPPPSARQSARYELRRIVDGTAQTLMCGGVNVEDCIE